MNSYVSLAWCASADETILYYLVRFATIATLCHHHHHHETMIFMLQSCCRCCSQLSEAASCRVCIYVCLQRGFFILCTFAIVQVFIFHTQYVVVKNIDLMFRISNFDFRRMKSIPILIFLLIINCIMIQYIRICTLTIIRKKFLCY